MTHIIYTKSMCTLCIPGSLYETQDSLIIQQVRISEIDSLLNIIETYITELNSPLDELLTLFDVLPRGVDPIRNRPDQGREQYQDQSLHLHKAEESNNCWIEGSMSEMTRYNKNTSPESPITCSLFSTKSILETPVTPV